MPPFNHDWYMDSQVPSDDEFDGFDITQPTLPLPSLRRPPPTLTPSKRTTPETPQSSKSIATSPGSRLGSHEVIAVESDDGHEARILVAYDTGVTDDDDDDDDGNDDDLQARIPPK